MRIILNFPGFFELSPHLRRQNWLPNQFYKPSKNSYFISDKITSNMGKTDDMTPVPKDEECGVVETISVFRESFTDKVRIYQFL